MDTKRDNSFSNYSKRKDNDIDYNFPLRTGMETQYNTKDIVNFFYSLDKIFENNSYSLNKIFEITSNRLKRIFKSRFIEFLMLKGDELEYSYISIPDWMTKLTNKLSGITAIVGMKIPLFEGSMFKKFIDEGKPRELITYEDRLQSFKDFVKPDTPENIHRREKIAPNLMKFFNYDYVFQIPLIVNCKVFGYFSFLQKGRLNERSRADIIMLSGKIANLISLRKKSDELVDFCKNIPQGIALLNPVDDDGKLKFKVMEVNSFLLNIYSCKKRELLNKNFEDTILFNDNYNPEILEKVYLSGKTDVREIILSSEDKSIRISSSRTDSEKILFIIEDVTEKYRLANFDVLTNTYNRHTILNLFTMEISRANREKKNLGVFFIDLNNFKPINDKYGHSVGDTYLKSIAQAVKSSLRETDLVGRYGGDEFIVVTPIIKDDDMKIIAEKITKKINSTIIQLSEITLSCSASIGIALYKSFEKMPTMDTLIHQSDMAMYHAKKHKLPYVFYNELK